MRNSTELHRLSAPDEAPAREGFAPGAAPIVFLRRELASNDASTEAPASRRDGIEPWLRASVAAVGFGASLETVPLTKVGARELQETARAYRSYALGEIIVALVTGAAAFVREARARWLKRRQARAINAEFGELDDRTLRDLGLHRSEIGSLAAEVTGDAERTRMLALLTRNGFLM